MTALTSSSKAEPQSRLTSPPLHPLQISKPIPPLLPKIYKCMYSLHNTAHNRLSLTTKDTLIYFLCSQELSLANDPTTLCITLPETWSAGHAHL